jgi:hypothetical protein
MAVSKAFRRFTQHNKPHSLLEMRRIDTQRCEDIFKAFLPALLKGDCASTAYVSKRKPSQS